MRHPYMTNAQRLSSAQTMHDRATDDRTDFSDWYGSDDYADWHEFAVMKLLAGHPLLAEHDWGIHDRCQVLQKITWWADCKWSDLTTEQKDAVDCWRLWCEASAIVHAANRYGCGASFDDRKLLQIYEDQLEVAMTRIAADMVNDLAPKYYAEVVAK